MKKHPFILSLAVIYTFAVALFLVIDKLYPEPLAGSLKLVYALALPWLYILPKYLVVFVMARPAKRAKAYSPALLMTLTLGLAYDVMFAYFLVAPTTDEAAGGKTIIGLAVASLVVLPVVYAVLKWAWPKRRKK